MINRHQAYVWSYDNPVQRHHLTERRNEPNLVRRQADLFMGLPQRGFRQGSIFGIPLAPRESNLPARSEEHTSELQSRPHLVCRLLLEKKKNRTTPYVPGLPPAGSRICPSYGPSWCSP